MASHPSVNVARLTYLLVCEAAGVAIALSTKGLIDISISTGLLGGLGVAGIVIWIESLMKGFTLRGFSTASFGLGIGLFCAWLLTRVEISSLLELAFRDRLMTESGNPGVELDVLRLTINVTLYASLGFLGAVLALRSNRDDFAFIIPYVRFRQDASSGQPIVLDSEAVMGEKVLRIFRSGFLHGRLIVPRFILDDLQMRVESGANIDRQRAQRGLESLEKMQLSQEIQISIHDTPTNGEPETIHSRLIETTRMLGARLMTDDDNLAKVARIQGLDVLSLRDLNEALKPTIAIGERINTVLVRTGKEDHQAVGYLSDGTMIVVNHAIAKMGSNADVIVVSTLLTSSGMMVFGDLYKPS